MSTQSVLVPFEGEQIELKLPGSWEILEKLEPTPLHLFFGDLLMYLEQNGAKRENMLVLPALHLPVRGG